MSTNGVPKENLRIDLTKGTSSESRDINRQSQNGLKQQNIASIEDGSHSRGVNSKVSFVSKEENNVNKFGRITKSSSRSSRTTSVDKKILSSPSSHDKNKIANSILVEIISKLGDSREVTVASSYLHPEHAISKLEKNVSGLTTEPPMRTGLRISQKHKEDNMEKTKKREVNSIVRELELPIIVTDNKPHVESRPRFEQIVLDSLVTTSSTIITKPGGYDVDYSSLASSQLTQKKDDVVTETNEDKPAIGTPFDLCWCFGFNSEVPIINLSNEDTSQIVFANSQYAAIYDFHEDTMSFMQGHLNTVSCMSTNPTGSLVVTADSGPDVGTSRVIVWDRRPCVQQILENVHPHGCQYVGLSPKGDFIVTVSANEIPPCIKVWEWEKDNKNPSVSITAKESSSNVKKLTVHANSNRDFAVTFERSVMFSRVIWQAALLEGSVDGRISESIKECEIDISTLIPSKLGSLTDTTFLESSEAIALSSTCKGYVIVWEDGVTSKHKKTYRKYVRLHLDSITNIQAVDNKIAVATASGYLSFYDSDLKILFVHKLQRDPLISLSFNLCPQKYSIPTCVEHQSCANAWRREPRKLIDASLKGEPFSVRHFVVSTESGKIAYVNTSCGTPKYLMFPSKEVFTALDMLPNSKFLCAGTAAGKCLLFDTDQRKIKVIQKVKVQPNSCQAISFLKFSPPGFILACGMYTGDIWLLDPLLLTPTLESPLTNCSCCITEMLFSPDSEYLIVSDVSFCISVYLLGKDPVLIGQYIAHFGPIVSMYVNNIDPGSITFYTISSDRTVCKFVIDREQSSLNFVMNQRVEQCAIPMYSVIYPYPYSSAGRYLGVNNELRFRLHDPPVSKSSQHSVTKRCRGKILAPDFGSPITYMECFINNGKTYLFFKTDHHIGIHLLPIDGNPFRALGFRASPTVITRCTVHPDGKYVFTISESCSGISMWKINIQAVEDFFKSGGEDLEPFLMMLGEEEERKVREFFDLGQFLHQGENPNLVRTLRNSLPICEVANVLQALGCLLTKHDMLELTNEVISEDPDNPNYNIEYEHFLRLYLNFRRTNGLKLEDLRQAFREFYTGVYFSPGSGTQMVEYDPIFDSASFMQNILTSGEEVTADELYADLSILTGGQPDPSEDEHLLFQIPPTMPKEISFETFVKEILGFSVEDTVFNGHSDSEI